MYRMTGALYVAYIYDGLYIYIQFDLYMISDYNKLR